MSIEFSVLNPPKVDAIIVAGRQGDQGIPGPNEVTTSTSSNLNGVLVADGNKVREALPGEVVNSEAMQSALPAPLRIPAGKTYVIHANQQVGISEPIEIEGVLVVEGVLYQV